MSYSVFPIPIFLAVLLHNLNLPTVSAIYSIQAQAWAQARPDTSLMLNIFEYFSYNLICVCYLLWTCNITLTTLVVGFTKVVHILQVFHFLAENFKIVQILFASICFPFMSVRWLRKRGPVLLFRLVYIWCGLPSLNLLSSSQFQNSTGFPLLKIWL